MRRAPIGIAAVTLILALASACADAAPTVRFKALAVPIAGFSRTGYILGAGAALEAQYSIEGTEYGGYPPPLSTIEVFLPKGSAIHPADFPVCTATLITLQREPARCPAGSRAGPVGHATGVVSFGETRVAEEATIESFYTPGGLTFFTFGHSPVLLEIPSGGSYSSLSGTATAGPVFTAHVPLVQTVPGAPDASVESIDVRVGSATRVHGRVAYYGTVPRVCPRAGFAISTRLTFAEVGGLPLQRVSVGYTVPCPRR